MMRMSMTGLLLAATLGAGCSSYEYRDTNAAVDANPACASRPDRPGEPVAKECERQAEARWSSTGANNRSEALDFSGRKDD